MLWAEMDIWIKNSLNDQFVRSICDACENSLGSGALHDRREGTE